MWCSRESQGWAEGGSFKKEGICVYIWQAHAVVLQKLTQHCEVIILP